MAVHKYPVGPGWWPIIDQHLAKAREIDSDCALTVKEKYGDLCADIETRRPDCADRLYQIEREMEAATLHVCEECGAAGQTVEQNGWLSTLCDRCAALNPVERRKVTEETMERYYHGTRLRTGEPKSREAVREKHLTAFLGEAERAEAEPAAYQEQRTDPGVLYDAISELQGKLRSKYAEYTTEAVPVLLLRALEGCDALKTYLEGCEMTLTREELKAAFLEAMAEDNIEENAHLAPTALEILYDAIMALQKDLRYQVQSHVFLSDAYREIKALAATYELQEYLAGAIARDKAEIAQTKRAPAPAETALTLDELRAYADARTGSSPIWIKDSDGFVSGAITDFTPAGSDKLVAVWCAGGADEWLHEEDYGTKWLAYLQEPAREP